MDRGAWWAAVVWLQRVGHDLATGQLYYNMQCNIAYGIIHIYYSEPHVCLYKHMHKHISFISLFFTQVPSLSWEDPQEKEMATHSSSLAWRIPWTEEPGGLQFIGTQLSN